MSGTDNQTDANQMTGAEIVVQALKDNGVEHVFGYPGGAVLPIYDEIFQQDEVQHILVRHEQGAGHAAEGYARSTGKVGVMLVTSGPGATNAVTPLQDALMDSIPLVCLTGQVPTSLIGSDAFQEATRSASRALHQAQLAGQGRQRPRRIIHEAFHVARPAVRDRSWSTFRRTCSSPPAPISPQARAAHRELPAALQGDLDKIRAAVEMMAGARKPIIYSGGGVINSGPEASHLLRELVDLTGFPDHVDADGPRRLSGIGQELAGHARHARHLRSQHGDA
jgi:acetolactate synthase-1/2/3 large subunit